MVCAGKYDELVKCWVEGVLKCDVGVNVCVERACGAAGGDDVGDPFPSEGGSLSGVRGAGYSAGVG